MHSRFGPVGLALCLMAAVGLAIASAPHRSSAAGKTFTNPVYKHNFPDPFVLKAGKWYWAYATGSNGENFQVLRSRDLVHWKTMKDAMPITARWASGDTWAPEVIKIKNRYVMYYAAHWFAGGRQCIGRAVSKSPGGPFRDTSKKPFLCEVAAGGSIDPDPFRDRNGKLYLLWKTDWRTDWVGPPVCCKKDTHIWAQALSKDGSKLVGKKASLEVDDAKWESILVEAPTMRRHGSAYYLFYSGNRFNTSDYATGYAVCKGPMGPCEDNSDNPILKTRCQAAGPGHQAIITDAKGQDWIVYHAWKPSAIGDDAVGRVLWIDKLNWENNKPVVEGPTCDAQAAPATGS